MESNIAKSIEREVTDLKYNSIQLRKELRGVHAELQRHRDGDEARKSLLDRYWSIHELLEADKEYCDALANAYKAMRNRVEVIKANN